MEAIISAADQAAWAGKSLLDPTMPQRLDTVVLANPIGAVRVAGISGLPLERLATIINRGPFDVTLMANDTAAPVGSRFAAEKLIPAGCKTSLFPAGLGVAPAAGTKLTRVTPVAGNVASGTMQSTNTISWNHTVAAGDNLLVIAVVFGSLYNLTGVTFNGAPASVLFPPTGLGAAMSEAVYYVIDPPIGTFAVNGTFDGVWANTQVEGMSLSVKDADTASPFGPVAHAGVDGAGTVSCSPRTSLGQLVLGVGGRRCSPSNNFNPPTAPEVELINVPGITPIHIANLTQRPSAAGSSLLIRSASNVGWTLAIVGFGVKGIPGRLLADDFEDGVIDQSLWTLSAPAPDVSVSETGGALVFATDAVYSGVINILNVALSPRFNFTGKTVELFLDAAAIFAGGLGMGSGGISFTITDTTGVGQNMVDMYVDSAGIGFRRFNNGVASQYSGAFAATDTKIKIIHVAASNTYEFWVWNGSAYALRFTSAPASWNPTVCSMNFAGYIYGANQAGKVARWTGISSNIYL